VTIGMMASRLEPKSNLDNLLHLDNQLHLGADSIIQRWAQDGYECLLAQRSRILSGDSCNGHHHVDTCDMQYKGRLNCVDVIRSVAVIRSV
jgi:hypothetical protein